MSAEDKARKAWNGRRVIPRGEKSWIRAARYLEGAGFFEAAEELARAAREPLRERGFWTEQRLEAMTRVFALTEHSLTGDPKFDAAGLLLGMGKFVSAKGLLLLAKQTEQPTKAESLAVRRRIAYLATLLLDLTEPGWRHKLATLRALDRDG